MKCDGGSSLILIAAKSLFLKAPRDVVITDNSNHIIINIDIDILYIYLQTLKCSSYASYCEEVVRPCPE